MPPSLNFSIFSLKNSKIYSDYEQGPLTAKSSTNTASSMRCSRLAFLSSFLEKMKKKRPTHKEGAGNPPRTKLQDEPLHKVSLIFDFVQFSLAKCLASLVVGDGWVGGWVCGLVAHNVRCVYSRHRRLHVGLGHCLVTNDGALSCNGWGMVL